MIEQRNENNCVLRLNRIRKNPEKYSVVSRDHSARGRSLRILRERPFPLGVKIHDIHGHEMLVRENLCWPMQHRRGQLFQDVVINLHGFGAHQSIHHPLIGFLLLFHHQILRHLAFNFLQ